MKIQPILPFLVISIYWTCLHHNSYAVSGLCLEDQRSLMLQLKNNLTFKLENSTKLKSWNQSTDCCQWDGVTCDDEGRVTALDLSEGLLSGGFDNSSSLFSLQHLQILNLAYNNFDSTIPSGFEKLENLTYLNLSNAGFVGQIPMGISHLTKLVTLDLSSDDYLLPWKQLKRFFTRQQLKLEDSNLRKLVQNLTSIRKLYLDGVLISAQGQEWSNALLLLPSLQELSMSRCNLSGPLFSLLARLQNLSVIILDRNNLSSPVPDTVAELRNLTNLSLSYCGLTGTFPQKIFQVQTLSVIDISGNNNLHGFFPDFSPKGSLNTIIVRNTSFYGALPHSIGNVMQLSILDLSNCQFDGTLPGSLSKLTELSQLDLSLNKFISPIPSFEGLQNLIRIDLSFNSINGSIPSSLFTLPSLEEIWLSNNQFSQLEEFTNVSSSVLRLLDLSSNDLSGPIPACIFQLSGLSILQLSSNKFNGSMHLNNFSIFRNLTTLDLSYNNLSLGVNVSDADLSSFPNISDLNLASCNVKTFPAFLRYQSIITYLDLSDNQIQETVPNWIWKPANLLLLNVSHNYLIDLEVPLPNTTSNLLVLDLHHNRLQGPIPFFPKDASYVYHSSHKFSSFIPVENGSYLSGTAYLSLSNNNFSGNIPDSICTASILEVLDLSHNKFSGTIPSCLMTSSEFLGVLNLGSNKLTGPIPNSFPTSCALQTVDFSRNQLEGPLPKSLANCTELEVLDIGTNLIVGSFPCFLSNIFTLRVLVMRNNKFHGPIGCPSASGGWHMLQIIDLAFNQFSGELPGKSFKSWKAMMSYEDEATSKVKHIEYVLSFNNKVFYQDSVTVVSKGQLMELVKVLTVFTTIDLSHNQFEGPVPKELTDFKALYALNLSNNALSGQIPTSIGCLNELESLDLSNNSLEGEIPIELASLNFLSVLNLSFNHLTGKIPTGTQLQSFQPSSFEGNDGLYGPPLTQIPNYGKQGPSPPASLTRPGAIDWNFLSAELGLVFGLGIVIGPLLFWKRWRLWYWEILDRVLCRIFPQLSLEYETRRGKRYKVLIWRH